MNPIHHPENAKMRKKRTKTSLCSGSRICICKVGGEKKTISFSFGVRNVNFASDKTFLTPSRGGAERGLDGELFPVGRLYGFIYFSQVQTAVDNSQQSGEQSSAERSGAESSRESSSWPAIHFNSALR